MPQNESNTQTKIVKIPAYISEPNLNPVESNYEQMVSSLISKVDSYNNTHPDQKYSRQLRGKNIIREIPHVDYDKYYDGETPVLLLHITEKKRGFTDLSVEKKNTANSDVLSQEDALTTVYNSAVFYPVINHMDDKISTNWIIFVYIDPGKIDRDITSTIKLFLNKILGLKIKHLKTNAANELIRRQKTVANLKVQYVVMTNNDNENLNIRGKLISSRVKEIKDFEYENVDSEDVEHFVNNRDSRVYTERKVSVSLGGNQELKYIHKPYKDQNTINSEQDIIVNDIEQVYNYEVVIQKEELKQIYNADFILKLVRGAAQQFFGNV